MMQSFLLLFVLASLVGTCSAFLGVAPPRSSSCIAAAASDDTTSDDDSNSLASVYSSNDEDVVSFFHMQQIPTSTWAWDTTTNIASSASRLDHVVDCAEHGECNVEEMTAMIDELERLNAECTSEHSLSRECHLDAVAARNVLKVALASKVAVEEAMKPKEDNPFATMFDLDDESYDHTQGIPTASIDTSIMEADLDRILQCAEDGECPIGEMTEMMEELERLNLECEHSLSRECSLDAVAARNILKVALASQAAMARQVKQSNAMNTRVNP